MGGQVRPVLADLHELGPYLAEETGVQAQGYAGQEAARERSAHAMKKPRMKTRAQIEAAHALLGSALEIGVCRGWPITARQAVVSSMEVLCWVLHGNDLFDVNLENTADAAEKLLSPEGLLAKLPTSETVQ